MRLEVYDDVAMLFHSDEKDILLVQHMIENLFFVQSWIFLCISCCRAIRMNILPM